MRALHTLLTKASAESSFRLECLKAVPQLRVTLGMPRELLDEADTL